MLLEIELFLLISSNKQAEVFRFKQAEQQEWHNILALYHCATENLLVLV